MLTKILRLFARKPAAPEFTPEDYDKHYEVKRQWLEGLLGSMHDTVGHAIIPYAVGGAVDMYYFSQPNGGTAFATMELIEPDGSGPQPSQIGTYELAAYTKLPWSAEDGDPFQVIERRLCGIFTTLGRYSTEATLNPGETCEVPAGENEPNRCLVFDEVRKTGTEFRTGDVRHGLLLCVEIYPSELAHAHEFGSSALIDRLKAAGHYPFSDLTREAVA